MSTPDLPAGEVTLLFTDVEGSTRLWELHGERMLPLLEAHDGILERSVSSNGGVLQRSRAEGDSGFAVFSSPAQAVRAAIALQVAMAAQPWPEDLRIRTRAALHTGTVEVRGDTYYGPVVNRCVKLRALAHGEQVIASKACVDALGPGGVPDGATFADLGTHRLKGLAVPERVYELRHSTLRADFPPLRSPDVEQHNLPEIRGRFVGRSAEQRAVSKALEVERLVTLLGTGGVGKTRLSLEVAWGTVAPPPGPAAPHEGTWFVDLTGARAEEDVDAAVAAAVGVREQPGRSLLETVADHLGGRAALVVLDNCEQVVGPARRVVADLLARCPNVRILATSREPLGLDGELRRPVPGLPLADAVDLFRDRAGLATATVGAEAAEAIERLCERLDGIPFAIEIAAARAEAIGPEAIEQGVARAQVEEAGRSVLEATLAWSHALLEPDEQVLFRRLGIFAGAFPLEAAETVAAFDPIDPFDVLDLVAALVERSLVHRSDAGYRQLVVVREWAAQLAAAADEHVDLAARHLDWCLELALAVRQPGVPEHERMDRFRMSAEELLIALDRGFDDERAARQVELAGLLEELWVLRGAYAEGRSRLEALLVRGAGFRSHRAAIHRIAALLANHQGDLGAAETHLDAARGLLDEILEELRAGGSPHVVAIEEHLAATLLQAAEVALTRGEPRRAGQLAERAASLGGALAPTAAFYLGLAEQALGDVVAAESHLTWALRAAEAAADEGFAADCLRNLGVIAANGGDLASAETSYRQALRIERGVGVDWRIARSLLNLAELLVLAGRDPTDLLDEGLALARALGDRLAEAHALSTLADLTARSDLEEAARLHEAALALRLRVGAPGEEALSRLRRASYQEMEGRMEEAMADSERAVGALRDVGDDRVSAGAFGQLARLHARRGDAGAAAAALQEATDRAERVSARLEVPEILEAAAWLAARRDRPADAVALLDAAEEARRQLGVTATVPSEAAASRLRGELGSVAATAAIEPWAVVRSVVAGV